MISLFIIWRNPAAFQAGGPVYFMVWSTHSCEKRELEEKLQNICSIVWCPCLLFDLLLLPSGLRVMFIPWCKASHHARNVSLKNIKIFSLLHDFLVYYLTWSCCPQGWGLFFSWCKEPLHASNSSFKNWKSMLYCCMLSFFLLAAAALRAGGPLDILVQSTPSCKWRELDKFENLCTIACFPCVFFDMLLLSSGLGSLFIWWCEAPFNVTSGS